MSKSPDAFRTISEVSQWLDTPAHVLRFWESRFTQIKPMKRAGGRRYYRPADMRLIGGIKKLLHEDGMTIRGVQKILREQGIKHVSSLSPEVADPVEDTTSEAVKAAATRKPKDQTPALEETAKEAAEVTNIANFAPSDPPSDPPADPVEKQVDVVLDTGVNEGVDAVEDALAEDPEAVKEPPVETVGETRDFDTPNLFSDPETKEEPPPSPVPDPPAPDPKPKAPVAAAPPSFLRAPVAKPTPPVTDPLSDLETEPGDTPVPMPTRLRDLADLGAIPEGDAQLALAELYRRLQALRDRVAGEL